MRDYALGTTFDIKFTTRKFSTGAPFTLAGTPAIAAYPDNSTTEITAGITLSVDFDSRTGLNNVRVVASGGNGYAAGSNYALVITAGTVDGVSVVGEVVGEFSIEAQSPLRPATDGRELVVDAAGLADANMVKAGPSGSGAAQTAGDIIGDTNDIQSRLPAALTAGGNMKSDVLAWAGAATATDDVALATAPTNFALLSIDANGRLDVIKVAGTTQTAGDIIGDTNDIQSRLPATLVGGRMDSSVGAMAANVMTAAAAAADLTTELQAGLATAAALATAQTSIDDLPTKAELATALAAADDAVLTAIDALPTNAELATALAAADDAVLAALAAGVTVATNNDKTGYALTGAYDFAKGTVVMSESYAANGVAPTPIQALYAIHQDAMQFGIAGTNYTVRKLDNATTAFVKTLDNAANPTAASRT
jgi:hypothetical protein